MRVAGRYVGIQVREGGGGEKREKHWADEQDRTQTQSAWMERVKNTTGVATASPRCRSVVPGTLSKTVISKVACDANDGEEERHRQRHPSERHDRCQESTRAVLVAPAEVSPLLSGNGSTNSPQDEEG